MRTYPTSTANKNVPKGVFLLAEQAAMSGEIVTTYYSTEDGKLWRVVDWIYSKPYPVMPFEVCHITGDTERTLEFRISQFFGR